MANFSFSLEAATLKAALVCVSNEETRYYLRGVSIEPTGATVAIVSTDGHRLFAARYEPARDAATVLPVENFLIPGDAIKRALTGYKAELINLRREGETWFLGDITFQPIDGTFPDWSCVFPSEDTLRKSLGTVAQFNPAYMADMGKVAKALVPGKQTMTPQIHHCGNDPAFVTFPGRDDLFCLVMPMRGETMPACDLLLMQDKITGSFWRKLHLDILRGAAAA